MKNSIIRIAMFGLLVAALAVPSGQAFGQEGKAKGKKDKAGAEKAEKGEQPGRRPYPFHGKVSAVDKVAKTITINERTFLITSQTRIVKTGKPATLDEVVVGEEIGGNCLRNAEGKLEARTVRIGPKPEGAEAGKAATKKEGEKKADKVKKEAAS